MLCLAPLPIAERHGLIFARASAGDPVDVDAHLAGAARELEPLGLERYVPFARHETERAVNWKLVIDGFLEAYHVPSLHRRTLGPTSSARPRPGTRSAAAAAWSRCGARSRRLRRTPEPAWSLPAHSVLLYKLFPNTVLIHQIDHVEIVQAYPGSSPDAATIVFSLYTPKPVTTDTAHRHFQANVELLIETIESEDLRLGEQIQRGFRAAAPPPSSTAATSPASRTTIASINACLGDPAEDA